MGDEFVVDAAEGLEVGRRSRVHFEARIGGLECGDDGGCIFGVDGWVEGGWLMAVLWRSDEGESCGDGHCDKKLRFVYE
jgi:hypothetical protein